MIERRPWRSRRLLRAAVRQHGRSGPPSAPRLCPRHRLADCLLPPATAREIAQDARSLADVPDSPALATVFVGRGPAPRAPFTHCLPAVSCSALASSCLRSIIGHMAWIVEYCLKCAVSRTDRPCPVCGAQTLALEDIQKAFSSPQPATDSKTTPNPRARADSEPGPHHLDPDKRQSP
jgi:hypothetical protein